MDSLYGVENLLSVRLEGLTIGYPLDVRISSFLSMQQAAAIFKHHAIQGTTPKQPPKVWDAGTVERSEDVEGDNLASAKDFNSTLCSNQTLDREMTEIKEFRNETRRFLSRGGSQ